MQKVKEMFYHDNRHMPKKTLALISGLVLVTVVLFIVALNANKQQTQQSPTPTPMAQQSPVPTVPAHSVLSLSPNPLNVLPGQQGTAQVMIDTSDNAVTAVQLEIEYDPQVISNVQATPGVAFQNPVVLINKNNPQEGRLTYAIGITPNRPTIQGSVPVASITFTARGTVGTQTALTLLPETLVTARGVASSVLKSATGTTVTIGGAQAGTTGTTTVTQPQTQQAAPTAAAPVVGQ